jgi:hypothetical protein
MSLAAQFVVSLLVLPVAVVLFVGVTAMQDRIGRRRNERPPEDIETTLRQFSKNRHLRLVKSNSTAAMRGGEPVNSLRKNRSIRLRKPRPGVSAT